MQKVKVENRCLVIKANNLRLRSHKVIIGVYRGQKIKLKQQKAKLIRLHFTHPYGHTKDLFPEIVSISFQPAA